MSFFKFTESDIAEAALGGKRQLAMMILEAFEDCHAKMNAEGGFGTVEVYEDFAGAVAKLISPFAYQSEAVEQYRNHTPHYPEDYSPQHSAETIEAVQAVLEANPVTTYGNLPRHKFNGSSRATPWRCAAHIAEVGDDLHRPCGFDAQHPIHI